MTYIDADGVLADFYGWVKSVNDGVVPSKPEEMLRVIVDNYRTCYLKCDELHENGLLMTMAGTDPDFYILTSLSSFEHMHKACPELSWDELVYIKETLKENKFKWFEKHGVPRHKVIIVDKRAEKLNYCQPGDILYDDFHNTIDQWTAKGGLGVFVESKRA